MKYGIDPQALTDSTEMFSAGSDTLDIDVGVVIDSLDDNQVYYFKLIANQIAF